MLGISQVQTANGFATAASVTATLSSVPVAGNLLVAVVMGNNNVNSDLITGWTQADVDPFGGSARTVTILYKIASGSESTSVTATHTAANEMQIWVAEYARYGAWSLDVSAHDGTNSAATATSRATGTTPITNQTVELAIAAVAMGNTVTNLSWTNGFTTQADLTRIHVAHLAPGRIAAVSSVASWTTGRIAGGVIAVFKSVGPTAPVTRARRLARV